MTGKVFVATSSAVSVATHVGRVAGYAGLEPFSRELIGPTVAIAVAILAGNALGGRLHSRLSARATAVIEYATLVVCVVLAVAGLGPRQ